MDEMTATLPADKQSPDTQHQGLLDIALVLAERARLLVFGPVLAGLVAFGIASLLRPSYTANAKILPPQSQSTAAALIAQLGPLASLAGGSTVNLGSRADTYVALLRTRTIADRLIDRFGLMQLFGTDSRDSARGSLAGATRIMPSKEGLIVIEVDAADPGLAMEIANAYADELERFIGRISLTEAQQRRVFLERQAAKARDTLRAAEAALLAVGVNEGLVKSAPQAVVENIARLSAQIASVEVKISTMLGHLTDSSPEVRSARRELASLHRQVEKARQAAQPKAGANGDEYLNRYREFKYYEMLFEALSKQYEAAYLEESRDHGSVQIVDPAVRPEYKSKPRRALIAATTTCIVALILVVYVLSRHALYRATQDNQASEKLSKILTALLRLMSSPLK